VKYIIGLIALALIVVVVLVVLDMKGNAPAQPAQTASTSASSSSKSSSDSSIPGLKITDEKVGTGSGATAGQTLMVSYTGTLTNGTVFDSTAKNGGQPFSFKLGAGQVIKGWDEGLVGMKVGGTRKLVIDPSLGYGNQAAGSIPPNSTLIFEVELLSAK
jgi:FKBP-type peptidyl-prolyl cis-trans isomerase